MGNFKFYGLMPWKLILFLIPISIWGDMCQNNVLYCPWAIYYSGNFTEELRSYDLLVLDSDASFISELKGRELYGYVSLGEVSNKRSYFEEVKAEGLLLKENPNWPGSYYIDLRKEEWKKRLLEKLIPEIILRGFQGIFLDTLDNAIYLEQQDPQQFSGMQRAAEQIVQLIGLYFPQLKIMMNRAYSLLPAVGRSIHILLAESLYTTYNFKHKIYEHVATATYQEQVKILKKYGEEFPHLRLFSLDYWYPNQVDMIAQIYRSERDNGFRPYVSVISLDRIISEP